MEIEIGSIVIQGKERLEGEKREKVKGALMEPVGFASGPKNNWKLTVDVGTSGVYPEAIVDGLKNKVGGGKTKAIGEEIFKFFNGWAPCAAKNCEVKIAGADSLGPWNVKWPKDTPPNLNTDVFSTQVTAAMPLQAVLKILSDIKTKTKNPLASPGALDGPRIVIATKNSFKTFPKIKASDINDEFLGFFSLLTSYCVLADASVPNEGPKRIIPIMPRTDFLTQYNKFIEPKLTAQLADKTVSLYDIVEAVSGKVDPTDKLAKSKFKWATGRILDIADDWEGKREDMKAGTLEVGKFLNHLQGYNKATKKVVPKKDLVKLMDKTMRFNQIGALGSKMETILGTSKEVPIFEFRELKKVSGPNLGKELGLYEDMVIAYHKQFAKRSFDDEESQ